MATESLTRSQGGALDHVRRAPSVLARIAAESNRFLRSRQRGGGELGQAPIVDKLKQVGTAQAASGAVALAFGYLAGRSPEHMKVGPFPLELVAGLGSHAIGLIASPEVAVLLHAAGMGATDSFLNSFGRGLGRRSRKKAGLPPALEARGILSGEEEESTGGGALSDEELARLARRI
jgi:hypothetical protein